MDGKQNQILEKLYDIINFGACIIKTRKGKHWIWTKTFNGEYGVFNYKGKHTPAHRVAYILFVGPIPKGYDVHHKCGIKSCCNPAHLKPMSRIEHNRLHHNKCS